MLSMTGRQTLHLLLSLLSVVCYVDCVSLEVEVRSNRKTRSLATGAKDYHVLPHSDLEFSCIVSGMEKGMALQIVKVEIKLRKHGGEDHLYKPLTWPYIMADGDKLDDTLLETGRYTVSEETDGSLRMMVSSCLQEDTGLWACRILKHGQEYMVSEIDLTVLGPVQGMHLRQSVHPAENGTFDSGDVLHTSEGANQALSCTVFITNWLPEVVISISDANTDNYRNITGFFTIAPPPETLYYTPVGGHESPLRQYYGKVTYKIGNLSFTNADNLRRLYCTSMGGKLFTPKHVYLELDVQFKPANGRCEGVLVERSKIHLTCSVRANPAPSIVWKSIENIDLLAENGPVSIFTKIAKDHHTSTLTIEGVNSSFYGEYLMTASNKLGSTAVSIDLTHEVISRLTGTAAFLQVPWAILPCLISISILLKNSTL